MEFNYPEAVGKIKEIKLISYILINQLFNLINQLKNIHLCEKNVKNWCNFGVIM